MPASAHNTYLSFYQLIKDFWVGANRTQISILLSMMTLPTGMASGKGRISGLDSIPTIVGTYSVPDTLSVVCIYTISTNNRCKEKFLFYQDSIGKIVILFVSTNRSGAQESVQCESRLTNDSILAIVKSVEKSARNWINTEDCSTIRSVRFQTNKYFMEFTDYTCLYQGFQSLKNTFISEENDIIKRFAFQ
ncbi:MAG: hypothetical protein JNL57_13295 [Bacteroidetes bacterium]|nr:hypothetical protein [Bacteroidota bacterium]